MCACDIHTIPWNGDARQVSDRRVVAESRSRRAERIGTKLGVIPNLTFLRTKKDDGVFTKAGTESPRPLGVGAADAVYNAKQQRQEEGRGRRKAEVTCPKQIKLFYGASRDLPNFSVVSSTSPRQTLRRAILLFGLLFLSLSIPPSIPKTFRLCAIPM